MSVTRTFTSRATLIAAGLGIATLGACSSYAPTSVPESYLEGTALDRNPIGVRKKTEFLEVEISPEARELSTADTKRIRSFITAYRDHGHGPLILSAPGSSVNPELAMAAFAEARALAFENGVAYDEIAGSTHDENSTGSEPLILAFQAYEAIAPDCPSLAEFDIADISSNNEMPTLGCSVRANQAAMIADPADLLGNRPLDPGDAMRRDVILAKFREGEATASVRTKDESGTISEAVKE